MVSGVRPSAREKQIEAALVERLAQEIADEEQRVGSTWAGAFRGDQFRSSSTSKPLRVAKTVASCGENGLQSISTLEKATMPTSIPHSPGSQPVSADRAAA